MTMTVLGMAVATHIHTAAIETVATAAEETDWFISKLQKQRLCAPRYRIGKETILWILFTNMSFEQQQQQQQLQQPTTNNYLSKS